MNWPTEPALSLTHPLLERTANALKLLCRLLEQCFRPEPELTVAQWADRYRVLTRGAERGPWRTSRMPHLREPMECLSVHDPTQDVVLWFATQTGKTETGNNWVGYIIDLGLGDVMMVMPTSGTSKRSSKTRIGPLLTDTPRIAAKLRDSPRDASNTLTLKEFPGGFLMISGANSPAELKSEPVRFLFCDEVDEYEVDLGGQGHPIDLARKRQDTYGSRKKTLITSTCTIKGRSVIEKSYQQSDQRRRYVPCPHCEHEQVLRWQQFRWATKHVLELTCAQCGAISEVSERNITSAVSEAEGMGETTKAAAHRIAGPPAGIHNGLAGQRPTPASGARATISGVPAAPVVEAPAPDLTVTHACPSCGALGTPVDRDSRELIEVWYECEAGGCRIEERHKTWMFERGRWMAGAPGAGKPAGFHLPAFYSPVGFFSWRQVVADRLDAERDETGVKLKLWLNTVAAETYEEPGEQPKEHDLRQCVEPGYRLGSVPAPALLLTCGVDVQGNRLEAFIYGWGRGVECWLIEHQVIHGDPAQAGPGSVWEGLAQLLEKAYPHAGGNTVRLTAMAIDEGDGHFTQEVRLFARTYHTKTRPVISIKGQSQRGKPVLGAGKPVEINYRGQRLPKGVKVWPVGTDTAKTHLYNRLRVTLVAHEEQRTSGPELIHWPAGTPDEYFKQLTAERLVPRPTPDGFIKERWIKPSSSTRNEALDGWNYAYAAAILVGVQRINWDARERLINPEQRDLFGSGKPASLSEAHTTVAESEETGVVAGASAPAEPDPREDPPPIAPPTPPHQPAASGLFVARPPGRNFVNAFRAVH